jgi:CRP/FNR family cyclic AMP-dependent transcriptional regulator
VENRISFLSAVSLFHELKNNQEALSRVAETMQERKFSPGEAIITENETGSEMFLLAEGTASVFKSTAEGDPYAVAILQGANHAFFGEGALLDSDSRSATIKATTECRCLVLTKDKFDRFSEAHPEWALPIIKKIARTVMGRLRKSNNDLMLLYNALVNEIRGQ